MSVLQHTVDILCLLLLVVSELTARDCNNDNGRCSQTCDNRLGCGCSHGYKLNRDGRSCDDINECNGTTRVCSQDCLNTDGSYSCSCGEGYYADTVLPHYCYAKGDEPYLLMAASNSLLAVHIGTRVRTVLHKTSGQAVAVGFDHESRTVLWSDIKTDKIYRTDVDTGHTSPVLSDVTHCDGLAVDWQQRNIYWTDTDLNTISVATLRASDKKTLIDTGLKQPRAIALDPRYGWMYWTDWRTFKVERAGMDGTFRETLYTNLEEEPLALTIDYVLDKLYWLARRKDEKMVHIRVCDLDGSNRHLIYSSARMLQNPFGLALFEDFIFMSDRYLKRVIRLAKFGGSVEISRSDVILDHLEQQPFGIQIFQASRQPKARNHCGQQNGGCSHFCLSAPQLTNQSNRYTCACPDNVTLGQDGRTCHTNVTFPTVESKMTETSGIPTTSEVRMPSSRTSKSPSSTKTGTHGKDNRHEDVRGCEASGNAVGMYVGLGAVTGFAVCSLLLLVVWCIFYNTQRYNKGTNPEEYTLQHRASQCVENSYYETLPIGQAMAQRPLPPVPDNDGYLEPVSIKADKKEPITFKAGENEPISGQVEEKAKEFR